MDPQKSSSSLASRRSDVLEGIAARIKSKWTHDSEFSTENDQQPKRQKKTEDFTIQQRSGEDSHVETIQRNDDEDNDTAAQLESELERVRQKCKELERENRDFKSRLVENDNRSSQITKLEGEKDKLEKTVKGLHKLVEKHVKQSRLDNDLRIKCENEVKGKQKEIEDLRMQLIEMNGLRNENLQLKNQISVMNGKFEEIHKEFENKLKLKNNEIAEMMADWMDTHETLSKTQEENVKLKCESDCLKGQISKLTEALAAQRTDYYCQSDSLKKLEKDLEVKTSEINSLTENRNELAINYDQKLKIAENEVNHLLQCLQQMNIAIVDEKNENEGLSQKLEKVESNLKEKQEEIQVLLSARDQLRNFAENIMKFTHFPPDRQSIPLANQLEEFTAHLKDKLKLMDWSVVKIKSGSVTSKILVRQHN